MDRNADNIKRFDLIDSHCHLDFSEFDESRAELLERCAEKNISRFIVPGVSKDTWPRLKKIANQYSEIFPAYGLHPYFLDDHELKHVDSLYEFLQNNSAVAVGEIGLDYYLKELDRETQQTLFSAQLDVAKCLKLPVILHVRKAHDDVLRHLKNTDITVGAVHAFNGSYQQAKQYIDRGFKLGFGGALTYDRAKHLRALVSQLPLDAILLETDSPDMRPADYQEQYNTPLTVLTVLEHISDIRKQSIEEIAKQTTRNCRSVFSI